MFKKGDKVKITKDGLEKVDTKLPYDFDLLYDIKTMEDVISVVNGDSDNATPEELLELFTMSDLDIPECLKNVKRKIAMEKGMFYYELSKKQIIELLPKGEIPTPIEGIVNLFFHAVPGWDWVKIAKSRSVIVSVTTAEFIIGRLKEIVTEATPADVVMAWLNYGFSGSTKMEDWIVKVDVSRIEYKKPEK